MDQRRWLSLAGREHHRYPVRAPNGRPRGSHGVVFENWDATALIGPVGVAIDRHHLSRVRRIRSALCTLEEEEPPNGFAQSLLATGESFHHGVRDETIERTIEAAGVGLAADPHLVGKLGL